MKTISSFVAILLLLFTLGGCSSENKPANFDYGHIENHHYLNSFFNIDITLPSTWIVQTKEETEKLAKYGKDLASGDDKNMKAILNASEVNTANLLALFEYEVGAPVDFNPSFMTIGENLKNVPGVKNGGDYLFSARKLMLQSKMQYDHIDEKFEKITIGGKEFYIMNCTMTYMGKTIKQEYYSTVMNGFSLNCILTFNNDEQKAELRKILNSLK